MASGDEKYYIDLVKTGKKESFAWIVNTYKNMVYTICLRMLSMESDAEEAAQEVFIKAFRAIGSFQGSSKFSTWLYRISYNHCISVIRKKTRVIDLVDDVPDNEPDESSLDGLMSMAKEDRQKYVRNAIESLPETDAVIVTLFYYEGLSLEEIEKITGLTNSNIRIKLHRARKKLYQVLKKDLKTEVKSLL
jgi:RNA polymerase sigma-70 factor (ECF subfamily)